ncbi:ABC transporter ATP-binding protein [Thermogladius sp. 4427co]|uniref:ABC transporter ATP-binding protein n=1 Tax=Thermogladius sp. 4427co TaxID=3450718 RepID=UPI003F7A371A
MPTDYAVDMRRIVKIYPDGTVALRGVDFRVEKGEIHGLLGENGAGKTTLMKILAGILKPTRGEIYIFGRRVVFNSPSDALKHGIGMVAQYPALVPVFKVRENIFMGLTRSEADLKKLEDLMNRTGLRVDPEAVVETLPMGVRQKVEILKILYRNVRILILDEPTTNLTPGETEELFKVLRKLKDEGVTTIFISHKLKEVLAITDKVTVLRRGQVTGVVETGKTTAEELAKLMVGRGVFLKIEKKPPRYGSDILIVKDLWVKSDRGTWAVKGVSFSVREGEIFGIAGVEGNGQKELVESITGLRKVEKGKVYLGSRDITNLEPGVLYELGLAHIPEDRVAMGLVLNMNVAENSILGIHKNSDYTGRMGILKTKNILDHASKLIKEFDILTRSPLSQAKSLSGGNQQRLVLAREISKNPSVIIASNPTRGLDIASTEYIRRKLLELRDQGKAILLVSADLEEILQLSDRFAIMYNGEFMGVVKPEEVDEKTVGLMMGGFRLEQLKGVSR